MSERIDDLQRNGCRIIQRPEMFCFGMDAVLLASWVKIRRGMRVLDLCSGNGVIPVLMDARLPEDIRAEGSVHFTGVEINSISVDMARRSAEMNSQTGRITFLEGDVRLVCAGAHRHEDDARSMAEKCVPDGDLLIETLRVGIDPGLEAGSYDIVTMNPPYMAGGGGLTGISPEKTAARHEILCTLDDAAGAAARALKHGGHLYMVHRPHRLGDIFRSFYRHGLGVKRMRMVHPFADKEANMVLIDAAKGQKAYIHAERPLIVYSAPGVYTEEVKSLYD